MKMPPSPMSIALFVLVVLGATVGLSSVYWCELRDGESLSATVRNIGLVAGGIIGMVLALWRSAIAKHDADTAKRDAETAQRKLTHDRYERAVAMLTDSREPIIVAGVTALGALVNEDPERYRDVVRQLLEGLYGDDDPRISALEIAVQQVLARCRELQ